MTIVEKLEADNLLIGLVRQYSPSRAEQPAVQYLVEQMAVLGFNAFVDAAGNAVGEVGKGENTLILLGHIDTVPGNIPVELADHLLYGRGSVDAKGSLATFVCAAAQGDIATNWKVVVIGAVEEEAATSKGARFVLDKYQPNAVIIGEPSNWDCITVGYKGRLLVDYELTREIGHTAGPEISVCEDAHQFWHSITQYTEKYNINYTRVFDQITPSLRSMSSSDDGFLQKAKMTIGFRLSGNADVSTLKQTLQNLGGKATLSFRGQEAAFKASKSNLLTRAFIKAIQKEGGQLQFKVKSGTSDMNVVGPVWQCPIVAYGPGDSALDHTPNEHIDLQEYHKSINVLTRVLNAYCI